MEHFKEIVEKCLAGELTGTFIIQGDKNWHSSYVQRYEIIGNQIPGQYVLGPGVIYDEMGQCKNCEKVRIIDFIPDNMQEQIKIDIPEGKVPVMEQTESGVFITWKDPELTYSQIYLSIYNNDKAISSVSSTVKNSTNTKFLTKINVLRKLINIRNYFGKPDGTKCGYYIYESDQSGFQVTSTGYSSMYANNVVAFKEIEHAEQAIKMLGDELKYLFEPW